MHLRQRRPGPGIVTSVVETAEQLLDQRHLDAASLARMLELAQDAAERFAREENIEVEWERIWNIEPILFDEALIELADEAVREVTGTSHRLPSGPLHDAAEVSRAGIPTVMLFVQSLRGLSHTKLEDTKREHLALGVEALDRSPRRRSPRSPEHGAGPTARVRPQPCLAETVGVAWLSGRRARRFFGRVLKSERRGQTPDLSRSDPSPGNNFCAVPRRDELHAATSLG